VKQTHINCLQTNCVLRLKCAIAQKQIEGNRTVHKGYVDGKCNEYKPIKEKTNEKV